MSQVSKYPISDKVYNRIIEIFLTALINIKSKNEAYKFIEDFLTPTEKIVLAKRFSIALLLKKEYTCEEIMKILKVSQATISSVNAYLRYAGEGLHQTLDKIIKDEKMDDFWKKIAEGALHPISLGGKGTKGWKYLRDEIRKSRFQKPF